MADDRFTGVKVFSATKARDREILGDHITSWVRGQPGLVVIDTAVRLSSDSAFHCLSIVLFFTHEPAIVVAPRTALPA